MKRQKANGHFGQDVYIVFPRKRRDKPRFSDTLPPEAREAYLRQKRLEKANRELFEAETKRLSKGIDRQLLTRISEKATKAVRNEILQYVMEAHGSVNGFIEAGEVVTRLLNMPEARLNTQQFTHFVILIAQLKSLQLALKRNNVDPALHQPILEQFIASLPFNRPRGAAAPSRNDIMNLLLASTPLPAPHAQGRPTRDTQ